MSRRTCCTTGFVAGNPGRLIRIRFGDDDVARLLAARWWDWPTDLITEHAAAIMGGDATTVAAIARRRLGEPE